MSSLHALIPIRSGSTRFLDKNIYKIQGVPLFVLSAYAAIASGVFKTVTIASDSDKYLELARQYSLDTFHRSQSSSKASSTSEEVLLEFVNTKGHKDEDWIFLIQATSPFQQIEYFRKAQKIVLSNSVSSIVTATEFKGFFVDEICDGIRPMSQNKAARLLETGLFWGSLISQLKKTSQRFSYPYDIVLVDKHDTLDIDYRQDILSNLCRIELHLGKYHHLIEAGYIR